MVALAGCAVAPDESSAGDSVAALAKSAGLTLPVTQGVDAINDIAADAQPLSAASYNWLQFNGSPQHQGNNTQETTLAAGTVKGLTRLFVTSLPSFVDNAPVVLTGVSTSGGTRDLAFVTTRAGDLIAIDANSGAIVWQKGHGAGSCKINNGSSTCYTTSAPAVDPSFTFVYSYGLDGFVHKHRVGDGTEVTGGNWPALATTKPFDEKSSPALGFATAKSGATYLYVGNGGYPGDNGDYQGHVTAINLADGSQHVFNTLCSDQAVHFKEKPATPDCSRVQSAVWARSGVVYDANNDRIYFATGNGDYNPSSHDFGDTILALNADGTGAAGLPLDSYTPTNFQQLQDQDADLGSTAPAILPSVPGSRLAHLAAQSGKDAKVRLVNLDDLSGQGAPGHIGGEVALVDVPQGNEVLTALAVWTNPTDGSVFLFVANGNGLSGIKITIDGSGNPGLTKVWQNSGFRTSPLVANNVLYAAGSNIIEALSPTTGVRLWSDTQIGSLHWASPVVANGVLYIADESAHVTAYALPSSSLPAPWQTQVVGNVGVPGSARATNGTFTVSASGDDIWNSADAFRYVYQPLVGNGQIVARVASVQNTNPWAKAGVMIRETLSAGSAHAFMAITPGNGAAFQRRLTTGSSSTHTAGPSVIAPYWVRLTRSGNTFTGAVSTDGATWTVVGSDTITMASSVFVGLAVTAHDNSVLNSSSFDNVTVAKAGFAAKVNFQISTTMTPVGYLPDSGAAFGPRGNGFSYGWNADNSANARERNASNSPDKRYDTLIHMQKPGNPNASWGIALPNGTYSVRLVSGDPQNFDSVYKIDIEGVRVIDGTPTTANLWLDATKTVTVSDGQLTVSNGIGSSNDKVCFIEISAQ